MVSYQTEDTTVNPKEPLKLKPEMFCIRCKSYRKIRKNDRSCCQTEDTTEPVEPNEDPKEPVENRKEPDEDPKEPDENPKEPNEDPKEPDENPGDEFLSKCVDLQTILFHTLKRKRQRRLLRGLLTEYDTDIVW